MKPEQGILLRFSMAVGDVLAFTSLVRDIRLQYGSTYPVAVDSKFPGIWRGNPHLSPPTEHMRKVKIIGRDYLNGCRWAEKNRRHFCGIFHHLFEEKTRLKVPLRFPHGDLHLSEQERLASHLSSRGWIVVPGTKLDMTTKAWAQERWQELVDRLARYGIAAIQEGSTKKGCVHPPLRNVLNLVGLTSVRDLIVNIYHADGVICGESLPAHIAAALHRPCVVLAGGRVPPWSFEYSNDWKAFGPQCAPVLVPHRYLHTLGQLPCCQSGGCWTQRVYPLGDKARQDGNLCKRPTKTKAGQHLAECQSMLKVDHVLEAVMSYYEDATLPPPHWPVEALRVWRHGKGIL